MPGGSREVSNSFFGRTARRSSQQHGAAASCFCLKRGWIGVKRVRGARSSPPAACRKDAARSCWRPASVFSRSQLTRLIVFPHHFL